MSEMEDYQVEDHSIDIDEIDQLHEHDGFIEEMKQEDERMQNIQEVHVEEGD